MAIESRSDPQRIYPSNEVDAQCEELVWDVPEVPEVEFESLVDAVLAKEWSSDVWVDNDSNPLSRNSQPVFGPRRSVSLTSDEAIDRTLQKLKANKTLVRDRWIGFQDDPADSRGDDHFVFKGLEPLFDAIVDTSGYTKSNLLTLKVADRHTGSFSRSDSAPADGYMILKKSLLPNSARLVDSKNSIATHLQYLDDFQDMPVVIEFMRNDALESIRNNVRKVLWSMHHCMETDPRRRFMYGITIENSSLRLWYNDRSVVAVSKRINWMEDHRNLVKLLMGLAACAQPEQLGYDPTMRRVDASRDRADAFDPVYEIDVQAGSESQLQTFVTRRLIAAPGAHHMRGGGTRVWTVVRKGDHDPNPAEYVLKDVWVGSGRELEGGVLEELHRPNGETADNDWALKKHFLQIICHGLVIIYDGEDPRRDETLSLHRGGLVLEYWTRFDTSVPDMSTSDKLPPIFAVPPVVRVSRPPTLSKLDRNLRHYRIVLEGAGEDLFSLTSFKQIFSVLLDIVSALKYLNHRGYVHRDVSYGNILAYDGRGVLIDLEYAKRIDALPAPGEGVVGTGPCMSVEAARQRYVFTPVVGAPRKVPRPTWKHNPLHDLDSVWWISVWAVLSFKGEQVQRISADEKHFRDLFTDFLDRKFVSRNPAHFYEMELSYNQSIWAILKDWRVELSMLFWKYEGDIHQGIESDHHYAPAYELTIEHIEKILNLGNVLTAPIVCSPP